MRLAIKFVTLLIIINSLLGQNIDDYDSNSDISIGNKTENLDIDEDKDDKDDNDDERCSADAIIEQFNWMILPDDYEEGKNNVKDRFESFNQTIEVIARLNQYNKNVSQKMSEFHKRISNRLSEVLMTVDLPSECMTSLIRIVNGVNNEDLWALKCKRYQE